LKIAKEGETANGGSSSNVVLRRLKEERDTYAFAAREAGDCHMNR
jgi:hypothetical protein